MARRISSGLLLQKVLNFLRLLVSVTAFASTTVAAFATRRTPSIIGSNIHQSVPQLISRSLLPFGPPMLSSWDGKKYSFVTPMSSSTTVLTAKRSKIRNSNDDELNRWYDEVDENATPEKVFWDEMERQRLLSEMGGTAQPSSSTSTSASATASTTSGGGSPYSMTMSTDGDLDPRQPVAVVDSVATGGLNGGSGGGSSSSSSGPYAPLPMSGFGGFSGGTGGSSNGGRMMDNNLSSPSPLSFQAWRRAVPSMEQIKMAEATLSEYELYRVSDNWLDENLQMEMSQMDPSLMMGLEEDDDDGIGNEEYQLLNGKLGSTDDDREFDGISDFLADNNEPWQYFGEDKVISSEDRDRQKAREVPFPPKDSEFYFDPDYVIDPEEVERDELALAERMKNCKTRSKRLLKAQKSARAREFFARGPNVKEGYEHLWVAAVDNASYQALVGNFRDYGVEFADNFGDFVDHSAYDGLYSVEDMAAWKARQVYKVTGLPVIASRTSFEIEPVPPSAVTNFKDSMTSSTNRAAAATRISNPKVLSGYKINDVAMHVDYLTEALRPLSEPNRVTRFTTCMCFYDGEMEIFEYGVCDVDIHFCNSMRTFIPVAQAMNHMLETLKMTFELEYQKFLRTRMDDALYGSAMPGSASVKLRDRVLKDARVLPNDIIDVSKFMDSQVDVNLMDDCAQELAERFMNQKPTKIMTVATTGLVIALPMAKYLQVPVVYARKERNVVMADTYSAAYSSKTVGKNRQLLVSKSHVHKDDRILVVDDFLSSGASQEALLRIISDAGALAVGVGVLLEKVYDSGRQSLSGFDLPIQSLCRVASVKGGILQLVEEEGYDKMK